MISLLYHSHTVVPAHLAELAGLGVLEPDEQVLVALDGVLLDAGGQRLSGPTLHDYCLVTSLRVLLWARDYGRHLCYAFPLAELSLCEGVGTDPLHAQIQLAFVAPDEEEQRFTLTLLPLANLNAALALLRAAADAARQLAAAGVDAREAGPEIASFLGEQIYGHVDGLRPGESPYRWPGAQAPQTLAPGPAFAQDPASLPPGQIYAAGRLARSAWDTLRRTLREAELPFDLSSGSLRELTEAVRAINDLVHTVSANPAAQQMAMAFLNRQQAGGQMDKGTQGQGDKATESLGDVGQGMGQSAAQPVPPAAVGYHEIPLRRRGQEAAGARQGAGAAPQEPSEQPAALRQQPAAPPAPPKPVPTPVPDRREIPLRRRSPAAAPHTRRSPAPMSGSGDAASDDRLER